LVVRQSVPAVGGEYVYSLGASGALLLQGLGEYCLIGPRRLGSHNGELSIVHAVELNDIHLSLLQAGLPATWSPASEIRSQNELTDFGYAKDYDAVVGIRLDGVERRLALEYERSPKAAKHYLAIVDLIGQEKHLSHVLYLAPTYDLMNYVKRFFKKTAVGVYFGMVRDWHAQLLDMPVFSASSPVACTLRKALQ
jgi:hypothetical protein